MIHNRIRCGRFFQHIPGWQEKQFCSCGHVESIEHILLKCETSKQGTLWKEVGKVWKEVTGLEWIKLSINEIMGMGSVKITKSKAKKKELMTELYVTFVTTAIWSIWKNRNERVFGGKKETEKKQIKTWKESLKKEIQIEYEIIQQAPLKEKEKVTTRFLKKWSLETKKIRIEENKKGKRRLRIEI